LACLSCPAVVKTKTNKNYLHNCIKQSPLLVLKQGKGAALLLNACLLSFGARLSRLAPGFMQPAFQTRHSAGAVPAPAL